MYEALIGFAGVLLGAVLFGVVAHLRRRPTEELARTLLESTENQRLADMDAVLARIRDAFGALSREALSSNSEEFLKLAKTRLDQQTTAGTSELESKKKLIDSGLEVLNVRVRELTSTLHESEKDRREALGRLGKQLETAGRATADLTATTVQLTSALANPGHRGQWGERMAEDVLRMAGFVEGINYRKQAVTESGTKPDFAFLLPSGPRVNMDVKFPLANYMRYLESEAGAAEEHKRAFLQDVRMRVREVTTREYIDPADGTMNIVLVFIPNEQLYGFIHENDPGLLDFAMTRNVVLCSPLTLFAILAVIRQAADNFRLEQASEEILALLGTFRKEWDKYGDVVAQLGRHLGRTMQAYDQLNSTRTRQLERQLDRIEELRKHSGVALPEDVAVEDAITTVASRQGADTSASDT